MPRKGKPKMSFFLEADLVLGLFPTMRKRGAKQQQCLPPSECNAIDMWLSLEEYSWIEILDDVLTGMGGQGRDVRCPMVNKL